MSQQRIAAGEIVVGTPIPWDAYDKDGNLLLKKGYVITRQAQIDVLLSRGLFAGAVSEKPAPEKPAPEKPASFVDRVPPFERLDAVHHRLAVLFKHMENDPQWSVKLLSLCKDIESACDQDADAALASIFLIQNGRYVVAHPIHSAIVAALISRTSEVAQRRSIVAAALTMNISMLALQEQLCLQKGPLTDVQRQAIHEHPEKSCAMLQTLGVDDSLWLQGVLEHHETIDGKGYHRGLGYGEISSVAKIVALSDIYTAMIAERSYRPQALPNMAMREVFLLRGEKIDSTLSELFVKELGLYLPGMFVRLKNGEVAIVTRRGQKAHCPVVCSLISAQGERFSGPLRRDTELEEFGIQSALSAAEANVRVNPLQLWGNP